MQNFIKFSYLEGGSTSTKTVDASKIYTISNVDNNYVTILLQNIGWISLVPNGEYTDGVKLIYEAFKSAISAKPGVGVVTVEFPFEVVVD
jgi:hypothetical protein